MPGPPDHEGEHGLQEGIKPAATALCPDMQQNQHLGLTPRLVHATNAADVLGEEEAVMAEADLLSSYGPSVCSLILENPFPRLESSL